LARYKLNPAEAVVFALAGPIIVWPGFNELPEWLVEQIRLERLAQNIRVLTGQEDGDEATDAEVLAYLHTASLAAPLSPEWCRIYFHLFARYAGEEQARRILGPFLPSELSPDEERELRKLRRWLRRQAIERFTEKMKRSSRGRACGPLRT